MRAETRAVGLVAVGRADAPGRHDFDSSPFDFDARVLFQVIDMLTRYAYHYVMASRSTMSSETHEYLRRMGRKGGRARAASLDSNQLRSSARLAAVSRWIREKFGVERFGTLGFPGSEVVDPGLLDLAKDPHHPTVNALVVAELRPRLRRLGVPVPREAGEIQNPREMLFQRMADLHGRMAHARFLALLERADSFCDSLESWWGRHRAGEPARVRAVGLGL